MIYGDINNINTQLFLGLNCPLTGRRPATKGGNISFHFFGKYDILSIHWLFCHCDSCFVRFWSVLVILGSSVRVLYIILFRSNRISSFYIVRKCHFVIEYLNTFVFSCRIFVVFFWNFLEPQPWNQQE